jgi:MFS family permease
MREVLRSRTLMAAVVAYAPAITASNLIPLQVAAFATRQQLNNEQIGTVALCEVMALALTTIFATALSPRLGRIAGIAGPVAVVVGQIVSLWLPGMPSLCIVRALVGVGCGLAGAIVSRAIAESRGAAAAFGLPNGLSAVMIGSLLGQFPGSRAQTPGSGYSSRSQCSVLSLRSRYMWRRVRCQSSTVPITKSARPTRHVAF